MTPPLTRAERSLYRAVYRAASAESRSGTDREIDTVEIELSTSKTVWKPGGAARGWSPYTFCSLANKKLVAIVYPFPGVGAAVRLTTDGARRAALEWPSEAGLM